jgi:adenine-specific DNA methylase
VSHFTLFLLSTIYIDSQHSANASGVDRKMIARETKPAERTEERSFIETEKFPVALVSRVSAKEKGPGRPDYWEMVFWWTRKPLASARAIIAGCLLPEHIDQGEFVRALRLDEKNTHRHNPIIPPNWHEYFENKKLIDPFAGFGSVPLESLRLGLSTTAVEKEVRKVEKEVVEKVEAPIKKRSKKKATAENKTTD